MSRRPVSSDAHNDHPGILDLHYMWIHIDDLIIPGETQNKSRARPDNVLKAEAHEKRRFTVN
jgi:hypothetical protein